MKKPNNLIYLINYSLYINAECNRRIIFQISFGDPKIDSACRTCRTQSPALTIQHDTESNNGNSLLKLAKLFPQWLVSKLITISITVIADSNTCIIIAILATINIGIAVELIFVSTLVDKLPLADIANRISKIDASNLFIFFGKSQII